ncbi:MAG: amidohydrolase family protein [Synergistaceae bacterium]|nr:amidohydrolase family protein [Synergistaceae bacterium]
MQDFHVHTGHFKGKLYFSPEEVAQGMKALNVERYYFSSTSTGSVPFSEVRHQIESLVDLSEGRAVPFLWVAPWMLRNSPDLSAYFFCDFAGIKIHGYHQDWAPNGKPLRRVLAIARDKGLPVMFHTGGCERSDAGVYMNICREFPDVRIILAHGRPIDECVAVMKECPNAWADTAFMPAKHIVRLKDEGLISRVLWGTDFPVMRYFGDNPPERYCSQMISEARDALGDEDFSRITQDNFTL